MRKGRWILIILSLVLLLSACGKGDVPSESVTDTTTAETEPVICQIERGYTIVRAAGNSAEISDAAMALKSALDKAWDANVKVVFASDTNLTEKEILIGQTGRAESVKWATGLRYDDYVIAAENGKIVLVGGSNAATAKAVTYFINKYVSDAMSFAEGEIFMYAKTYPISRLTLDGVDLSGYRLVINTTDPAQKKLYREMADAINAGLQTYIGQTLPIESADSTPVAYEIVLGNGEGQRKPSRELAPVTYATQYSYLSENGKLWLNVGSTYVAQRMVDDYMQTHLADKKGGVQVDLTLSVKEGSGVIDPCLFPLAEGAQARIMTNNMLFGHTSGDRSALLIEQYMRYYPDVIGLQECDSLNHSRVVQALSSFYGVAGQKIASDGKTSYTPILYRLDTYELLESGCEYFKMRFTDTKMYSWAVLQNRQTGQKLMMLNAHYAIILSSYDTTMKNNVEGAEWRTDNTRQMKERAEALLEKYGNDTAVFLCGDFNCNSTAQAIRDMTLSYRNAALAAVTSRTPGASFHNAVGEARNKSGQAIDFIFVNDVVTVYTHLIPDDSLTLKSSDHSPVIIDISLK